jgi:hypothetical protein
MTHDFGHAQICVQQSVQNRFRMQVEFALRQQQALQTTVPPSSFCSRQTQRLARSIFLPAAWSDHPRRVRRLLPSFRHNPTYTSGNYGDHGVKARQ